jgi:polyisoprenoid-binding protein YceI
MRRHLVPTAALMCALAPMIAVPLVAATPEASAPGKPDTGLISGGRYEADPAHTLVEWEVDHLGFSPYFGLFGDITGTLDLDPAAPQDAKVSVTIPVAKVTTASEGLTAHLLRAPKEAGARPDFFGASPADATFTSTSVEPTGENAAKITGNLTLNGVTRPVTLMAEFYGAGSMPQRMGGGETVGFSATGAIKRSDFGLGFSVPMVSDKVTLKIAAAFQKK